MVFTIIYNFFIRRSCKCWIVPAKILVYLRHLEIFVQNNSMTNLKAMPFNISFCDKFESLVFYVLEIAQSFAQAVHFNTYGGNPISSAVGKAVLEVL